MQRKTVSDVLSPLTHGKSWALQCVCSRCGSPPVSKPCPQAAAGVWAEGTSRVRGMGSNPVSRWERLAAVLRGLGPSISAQHPGKKAVP